MMAGSLPKHARNLQGKIFGSLTVLRFMGGAGPRNASQWECQCGCGVIIVRAGQDLNRMVKEGYAPSCPACKLRRTAQSKQTHGMSKHPIFMAWCSMRARCRDPRRREWKNYGGRGITICARWEKSFDNFWRDMAPTWREGLELDRIDNEGHYEPGNCHWVPRQQNINNRRVTHPVNMQHLAEITGIKLRTLYTRWYRGQSMTSATSDPDHVSWFWAMRGHS
jgi:hypothetical protein